MEQLQDTETVEECINLVKKERPAATGMRYKDIQSKPQEKGCWALPNITESTEINKSGTRHYVCVFKKGINLLCN